MNSLLSNMILISKLHGFIIYSNASITSILSYDYDLNIFFSWRHFDSLSILESNLTWLVVINNSNSAPCIMTTKLIICIWRVKLNKEIFIGFPVVIINDFDFNKLLRLSISELDNSIICLVVMPSLCFSINCLHSSVL